MIALTDTHLSDIQMVILLITFGVSYGLGAVCGYGFGKAARKRKK